MNIRTKGATAERDIANDLNSVVISVMRELGYQQEDFKKSRFFAQRNQNQSAVGGQDLVNTYGYAIEVKRQELLNINTWWKQCVTSAEQLNEIPVLLFKQSRKQWRCITTVYLEIGDNLASCRGEIPYEAFLAIYRFKVEEALKG